MKLALVLDDRQSALDEIAEELHKQGYSVISAKTLEEAKEAVRKRVKSGQSFDLVVSDFDLGSKIYLKHRWLDGLRFVHWLKKRRIKAKVVFHSTAFEPHHRIKRMVHLPIIWWGQKSGAVVQGKSVIMPSQRKKVRVKR